MERSRIAVVGSGISGLSAAWLLSQRHNVVLFEAADRLGGHANTVMVETSDGSIPVDTGFIVYNALNYPNLSALYAYLDVATSETEMSFSVSMHGRTYEYSGSGFGGFFAQRNNLLNPTHWRLLKDVSVFFNTAEKKSRELSDDTTLGGFLSAERYSDAFINCHILPMASAIWSAKTDDMLNYPARSFISFYANHGMLQFKNRPLWRTVQGGSRRYIEAIDRDSRYDLRPGTSVKQVVRNTSAVEIIDDKGESNFFDHVVIATHADQALQILESPSLEEKELLKAFKYQNNRAVLHRDPSVMPKRRTVWSSWNYVQAEKKIDQPPRVTYWMNRLQNLDTRENLFVSLNPLVEINDNRVDGEFNYRHPIFSPEAGRAQPLLWQLQGRNRTWFCGSYFGHGFHEDGLQSGLAVAETLGGVRRPWRVKNESGRINLPHGNTKFETTP